MRTTTSRRRVAAIASTLALAMTAACSGGTGANDATSSGDKGSVKSIKLMAAEYSKDNTKKFWDQFAKTYQKKYGIKLDVQIVSWDDIDQQSSTMIQGGNPPDILNTNVYASFADKGLLYSGDDVLPPKVKDDLLPAFKKSGTTKGKLYGLPDLSSARALFCNKTLFKKAKIAAPPKTWDEFEADAKKIKALGGGNVGYTMPLGPEEAQAEFSIWTINNGGDWKSGDKWSINSAKNVETLQFLKKLAVTDKVTQNNPGKTNRTDGTFPLFKSGKAGMIVGFGPLGGELDKAKKVDYGVAPMPTNGGTKPQTYGVTDFLNPFKKQGNQQALKDFYELYYQPDQVNKFIKAENFLPVTKSGIDYFRSQKNLKVYLDTLPNVHLTPDQDPVWDKVKLAVQQKIGKAVTADGDPKAVLDDLQKTANGGS